MGCKHWKHLWEMCWGLSPNSPFHRTLQRKVIQRAEVSQREATRWCSGKSDTPALTRMYSYFSKWQRIYSPNLLGPPWQDYKYDCKIPPWYLCSCSAKSDTGASLLTSWNPQPAGPSAWFSCVPHCPCYSQWQAQTACASGYFSGGGGGLCWLIHTFFSGFGEVGLSSSVSRLWPHGKEAKGATQESDLHTQGIPSNWAQYCSHSVRREDRRPWRNQGAGHSLGFPAPEQPIKSCPRLSGEQIPLHSPGSWGCKPRQGKTSQESFLTIFISEGQGAEPARFWGTVYDWLCYCT